ncbi:pilus assembly protein TadG-related protein [Parafrankia discariae]|uniref:pilus assembly protein TadG-related protein n=1 Tax=Parafrankia discariae TaxID=365528 RepID=UPI00037FBBE3|nr:pilus assembly protein TadG-related protein [Parafrankia discariae]
MPDRTRDTGTVTAFFLVLTIALLGVTGLVVDGGIALDRKSAAVSLAAEAARAGAQALDLADYRASGIVHLDPAAARRRAEQYLAGSGAQGTVTATATTVTVQVTVTVPTQLLGIVGVDTLTVTGHASAAPIHGVTAPANPAGIP